MASGPAGAVEPLPVYAGSLDFPAIESSAAPEEYSWQVELAPGEALVQLNDTEAEITRPGMEEAIHVPHAYDLQGIPVPTSLSVTGDVVTLTVHHRDASFAYPVTAITPEERDTAPIREYDGFMFPEIRGPESPERYPLRVSLGREQHLEQVSPTEVQVVYTDDTEAFVITADKAHDAEGAGVPTSLEMTGKDVITLTVHHRAGNPEASGAPFVYPIISGAGWEGGWHSFSFLIPGEFERSEQQIIDSNPSASLEPLPVITCKVPMLRGYSLRGAKNRLRAAHCGIGAVRLADGTTDGKGKVVKQFHSAGTELVAGTPVAVKLGLGR